MDVWVTVVLIAVAVAGGVVVLTALVKSGKPIRRLLGGAVQGWCALAAVNVVGMFSGVSIGLNVFSAVMCSVLGVPGVIALLLLNAIFAL